MYDVFPKFIIEDGELILSKVSFHRELVKDKTKVKGGGWFDWNEEMKAITLFGSSDEFGRFYIDDVKACIANEKVYTYKYASDNISHEYNFYYRAPGGMTVPIKINKTSK